MVDYSSFHITPEEEEATREFLKRVMDAVDNDETGISIVDEERMAQFVLCDTILRKLLKGSAVRIDTIPHDDYSSVGTILVLAKQLVIRDPELFARAMSMASNYEICPRTDGYIEFAVTFYGMTKKFKEDGDEV